MHSVQLSLRSDARDAEAFPDTNDYRVELDTPLQRVVDIRLMTAEMASSQLTVEAGYNDALRFDDGIRIDTGTAPHPLAPPFDGIGIWANQCVVHERGTNHAALVTLPPHVVEIAADGHAQVPVPGNGAPPYRTAAPHGGAATLVACVPVQPPLSAEDLVFPAGESLVQNQLVARRTGASLPMAPVAEDETLALRVGQASRLGARADAHGGVLHHPPLLPSTLAAAVRAQLDRAQQRGHLRTATTSTSSTRTGPRNSGSAAQGRRRPPRRGPPQLPPRRHGPRDAPRPQGPHRRIESGYESQCPQPCNPADLMKAVDKALNGGLAARTRRRSSSTTRPAPATRSPSCPASTTPPASPRASPRA